MAIKPAEKKFEPGTSPGEITGWFTQKQTDDFTALFLRHDQDYELWDMNPYPLAETELETKIKKETGKHGSDIVIASNDLRTFSDNVQSTLASAPMQIKTRMAEPKGDDKRDDIGMLERLFTFAFDMADERLRRLLQPPLRDSLIWYSCIRGWTAARVLVYSQDKGKSVIFDIVPMDPRWLVYDVGANGLVRVGYKTFKSKSAVKGEWGIDVALDKNNEVIDYWVQKDSKTVGNTVVCGSKVLKPYSTLKVPSMPILISPVTTRPPIADRSGTKLKGYGESMFASVRGINAVRNRFATIVANHARLMANQALINYKAPNGKSIDKTSNIPGGVLELDMAGNRLEPSPMKEISPTVVQLLNFLNEQEEQALLPKIPIDRPPPSGTLYNLAQQAGNKVFNPQLRLLNNFYADMCNLIEEQLLAQDLVVDVKGTVERKYFEVKVKPVDLNKPHITKVEFTAVTPWTQMDTAQIAQMLKQLGLPDEWIWEHILHIQDPKALADLAAIELYEHSPKGAMKRAVEALMKSRGDVVAAQSLINDMDRLEEVENAEVAQAETPYTTTATTGATGARQ